MGVASIARLTISGTNSIYEMISRLEEHTEEACKEAVEAGAGILADDVRRRLEGNLIGSKYSTGDLLDSFGVTPVRQDANGVYDAKIGFHGYDTKGAPNQLKARVMESGSSKQAKRPFFRPAVNYNRKRVRATMESILNKYLNKNKKGGQ